MSKPTLFAAALLTALLSACGTPHADTAASAASSGTLSSVPAQTETQTAVPSAEAQAQLAQLQAGLAPETTAGDARPGLRAQSLDCPTELVAPFDASALHTGMYWYAPSESSAPGGVGCLARADGGAMPGYYDPSKPVIIFVHGWQPDYVKEGLVAGTMTSTKRYNFWFAEANTNVADQWLKAGWNVAMYQWTQIADDESDFFMPFNSQAKIWTPNYVMDDYGQPKPIGMRWMSPTGYTFQNAPTISAGQMLYQAYKSALSQWSYAGAEPVRVVGHSLGAQMMMSLADQAYRDPALPACQRPARLTLADPYWSPNLPAPGHNYAYLAPDANPAARSARIAREIIAKGAVIDWVKSSGVLDLGGDNNQPLMNLVTRTEIHPDYDFGDVSKQHNAGPRWYLSTLGVPTGAATAENTQAQAKALMNRATKYEQLQGRFTPLTTDDTFFKPLF